MRRLLFSVVLLFSVGCGPSGPAPAGYAGDDTRDFVKKHRVVLEKEIGVGSGPRLYDLAILANCQDIPQLNRRLHKRRADIFEPNGTSDEVVADRVVRFLQDSRELRCHGLDLSRQRQFAAGRRDIGPRRSQVSQRGGSW